MALRFQQSFVVRAAPDRVWAYLIDPYRVVKALPGAEITEKVDETTYRGTITVKVGPVSARYRGTVRFEKLDVAAHVAEVAASGQETSGKGGADMRMTSRLVQRAPGETEASVVSEVNVTGILAQFGRGMIQDVSDQMFQKFTDAVRAELEGPTGAAGAEASAGLGTPAAPIDVASLGSQAAARALLRAAQRPLFWVVIAALALLAYWLLR